VKVQRIVEHVVFYAVITLLREIGGDPSRRHSIAQALLKLTQRLGSEGDSFILTVDSKELDEWSSRLVSSVLRRRLVDESSDNSDIILAVGACVPRLFEELDRYARNRNFKVLAC
jgi:hypothetical protein